MSKEYYKRADIGIYKANKNKTGSVAQFQISGKNDCMFLEMARQIRGMDDSKPYDWDSKLIVKLGIPDITKMLALFNAQLMYYRTAPAPLKLFHKNAKGSKTIELKWQAREWKGVTTHSYYLTVSSKEGSNDPVRVSTPISLDEVELLKVGFNRALEIILGW